jgi:hypothetical protein
MAKGSRANFDRLLRSAWERQIVLRNKSFSTAKAASRAKKKNLRMLEFIEHPLFILPAGTLSGLVGMFFYTPVLFVCGVCILLAFHRAGVVKDESPRKKILSYAVMLVVVTLALYGLQRLIGVGLHEYVQEMAGAVFDKIKSHYPSSLNQPPSAIENPDLRWGKENAVGSTYNPENSGDVLIVWVGQIENLSSTPSKASNWNLQVTLPGDSRVRSGELLPPKRHLDLSRWDGLSGLRPESLFPQGFFIWENYLPELTARTPIVKGTPVTGFVAFIVRDVPNARLVLKTKLMLSFDDGVGKTIEVPFPLNGQLSEMPYIPGLIDKAR